MKKDKLLSIVKELNVDLWKHLTQFGINSQSEFYKTTYPQNTQIAENGILNLPNNDGQIVSIFDPSISEKVKKDLGYLDGYVPYGMVLERGIELYTLTEDDEYQTIDVLYPGDIINQFNPQSFQRDNISILNTAECGILFFPHAWFESNGDVYHAFQRLVAAENDFPVQNDGHYSTQTEHLFSKAAV